jgi:TonB-linked SusC/RagA family outer membrane protein
MEQMPRSTCAVRIDHRRQWRAVTTGVVLALPAVALAAIAPPLAGTAAAQPAAQARVSGRVTGPGGTPLPNVTVRAEGSAGRDAATTTNAEGRYSIEAPARGGLSFTLIGYRRVQVPVGGRTTVDVALERFTPTLEQVVVTSGYQGEGQRRSQVSGAVASVNLETTQRQTSSSVAQRLDAAVSGVTVNTSGSPGGRSTVRIRGISSFQNNDPLYIVDGTPIQDTYVNFLNPADIASITVLKDASAASIYGSRASNGVIVIETVKRGASGPPRTQLSVRSGVQTPFRGYDNFLISNPLDYFQVVKQSYENANVPIPSDVTNLYGDPNNPSIPQYIWCGKNPPCTGVDAAQYAYPNNLIMPGSSGTNWWREVFGPAPVNDVNLNVSGAGTGTNYAVSLNYFDQGGTAAYNRFRRGSVRANTGFRRGRFSIGENLSIIGERSVGGLGDDAFGETGILGKNILSQPVVPVRDINGNFASGKAVGLGNNTNPLKAAWGARNNGSRTNRVFGNVYAGYDITPRLAFRTTLGGNAGEGTFTGYTPPTPENSEPTFNDAFFENQNRFTDWTWSNTLRYTLDSDRHDLSLLAGQETNRQNGRTLEGRLTNLVNSDVNSQFIAPALGTLGLPNSFGYQGALLSFFGQANYTLADRYTASFTLRRDGSSRLGPANQWGTFPAVGLAWRVSEESFLRNNSVISGLQLRAGYGVTGNQQIPAGRIVSQFGGETGGTFYDLNGTNTTLVTGYRQTALGNQNLRWEEQKSVNGGFDLGLLDNRVSVIADFYSRLTDNLLFNPATPATAGTASAPIVNIGAMRNRGVDFSVGYKAPSWNVTFNGSHYRNRITRIDGVREQFFSPLGTRIGNMVVNRVGQPIGTFFGLVSDGYFQTQAEIDALNAARRGLPNATPTAVYQQGAAPGRIKFRDVNGDGEVSLADRTVIGSPHPDFTGGLDATVRRGRFDLSATLFGSFGNEIFDAQKNFYVFRDFSTNVRSDRLANSWRPDNPNAKYPRLDVNDTFSRQISSYYVEDGSFVRMRALQLGYTLPSALTGNLRGLQGARVYLLGENLFTLTGYSGLDPSLPAANLTGAAGDIRDQGRGVDSGVYPTSRTFSIGVTTSF